MPRAGGVVERPRTQTWVFKLKQGVRFHDGGEFTADDVVHSYTRILKDPDSKQGSAIAGIDDLEAVDDYTVRVHTKAPDAALLFRLSQRFITSKAAYDRLGAVEAEKLAIGTGPYKFKEWVSGQRFVLEKNPNYSAGPAPADRRPGGVPQHSGVRGGDHGAAERRGRQITNVPPESADRLSGNAAPRDRADHEHHVHGHALVRAAIQEQAGAPGGHLAVDKEALTRGVLKGMAYPDGCADRPRRSTATSPTYSPSTATIPQRAQQLLAQAGYPNGFDVEFVVPLGQYNKIKELAEATASMLSDVGIRTRIQTQDQNTGFTAIQQGKAPLYVFGRGSVIDPERISGPVLPHGRHEADRVSAAPRSTPRSKPSRRCVRSRRAGRLCAAQCRCSWTRRPRSGCSSTRASRA